MKFADMSFEKQIRIATVVLIIIGIISAVIFAFMWNNAKYAIEHTELYGKEHYQYTREKQIEAVIAENKESMEYLMTALLTEIDENIVTISINDIERYKSSTPVIEKYEKELYKLYEDTKFDWIAIYKEYNYCSLEQVLPTNRGIYLTIHYDGDKKEFEVINKTDSDSFWIKLYDFIYNGYHKNYNKEAEKEMKKVFRVVEKHMQEQQKK